MGNTYHTIFSYLKLSFKKKFEVLRIVWIYIRISYILKYVPLSKYYSRYFSHSEDYSINLSMHKERINLVKRTLKHLPGTHTCLKESIIVHLYMKRFNIYIPIYVGVSLKDEFMAHAWYDENDSQGFKKIEIK